MSFGAALVIIVAILAAVWLRVEKYRAFGREVDAGDASQNGERERLQHEIADLQQRMAVLERILTEERRSRAIAEDIESLRDR